MTRRTFEVDRAEAKLMGVCAGLARSLNIDPTLVRIAFVVATLVGGWPWTLVAYAVLAMAGQPKRARGGRGVAAAAPGYESAEERAAVRDLDRRLAEVDLYVASSNGRLAREIEELR
ncbi:MAG TPA: PspC domain-containing protein [Allosphingosinicella sp.]|jgi:phage shock protein C